MLLATSDGFLNAAIRKPGKIVKEYVATLCLQRHKSFTDEARQKLLDGVKLADGTVRALEVEVVGTTDHLSLAAGRYCTGRLVDYTTSIRLIVPYKSNYVWKILPS